MLFKRIPMAEAVEVMQAPGAVTVDVRGRDEYVEGHIPGAICIPLDEITDVPDDLPDLEQTICVYCAGGVRSVAAAYKLVQLGYENVYDCGGIDKWQGKTVKGPYPNEPAPEQNIAPERFVYKRRANYHETDQMGIIHHSNYIKWMEEARMAYLEALGVDYAAMERAGAYSPVVSLSVDYKRPVEFGDDMELRLSVRAYNGVTLEFGYEFYNVTKSELSAEARSKHCFVSDGRPIVMKKRFPSEDGLLRAAAGE